MSGKREQSIKGSFLAACRPKPETLKRKEDEARALRNSRKGLRGAARVAADRPGAPVKGGGKTAYGPPKARGGSSGFARKTGAAASAGGQRQGPFAFSATVQSSAKPSPASSSGSSTGTGRKFSKSKPGSGSSSAGSDRKFSKSKLGSGSNSSSSSRGIAGVKSGSRTGPGSSGGKSIRLGGRRGENKVKSSFLRSQAKSKFK